MAPAHSTQRSLRAGNAGASPALTMGRMLLLTNAVLFDDTARTFTPGSLLIDGDRIVEVGPAPLSGAGTLADAVDLGGRRVVPGFVSW